MGEMRIEYIEVGALKPYEKNAKEHPERQVEQIAASIREFGFRQPIVVDGEGLVIAGHGRLLAAKRLGMERVPCVRADDLTETQVRALRLADNKTNESAWIQPLLDEELAALAGEIDMGMFGFEADKDEVVEDGYDMPAPKNPKAKGGELYLLGRHRLLCGDATVSADVGKLAGGQLADMLLTDPPYNVDYTGGTKDALKIENDHMPDAAFRQFLADSFGNARAVMKPGAAFYIWHGDTEGYNFRGGLPGRRPAGAAVLDLGEELAGTGAAGFSVAA